MGYDNPAYVIEVCGQKEILIGGMVYSAKLRSGL